MPIPYIHLDDKPALSLNQGRTHNQNQERLFRNNSLGNRSFFPHLLNIFYPFSYFFIVIKILKKL